MKQINYRIEYEDGIDIAKDWTDFLSVVDEIGCMEEYEASSDILLKMNFGGINPEAAQLILDYVHEHLPKAKTAGLSITLVGKNKDAHFLVMNAMFFMYSTVDILEVPGSIPKEQYETARQLMGGFLDSGEVLRGVEILASGLYTDIGSSVQDVALAHAEIPIFGAVAGFHDAFRHDRFDGIGNPKSERYEFICGKKIYTAGGMVIKFMGEKLHVHIDYTLGWKAVGKELEVTESDGNYCLVSIDNEPAADVYEKYLGVDPSGEAFIDNIFAFPMTAERKGVLLARVPVHHTKDGRLYFYGAVQPGDKLRLAYGNPIEILKETYETSERMAAFGPEAVSLMICGIRDMFLKQDADEEIRAFSRIQSNREVFCGTGQVYLKDGCGGMMNATLVAIGMRECDEPVPVQNKLGDVSESVKSGVIPLSTRLARFLEVTTNELKEKAEQAKAANVAKSQFLSNMSHEIRTPINAVLGMDEMILRESREPAIVGYAENIRTAGNSLLSIVNDVLDFSKIEAGKMDIIPVEYALSSMLNDLVTMIQTRADDKGLELIVHADPSLPSVLNGDEIRIKQVMTNLLTNAVKYTKKGSVTLTLKAMPTEREDNVDISIHVIDTGIGIRNEEKEKLFTAFERIDEKRNRNIEGTGLGMNITKRLLDLMGSKLVVESEYGKGSDFSFVLSQQIVNPEPIGDFQNSWNQLREHHDVYHESFTAPDAKILIVDDTIMNLTVIKSLLKQTKLQVDLAQSGLECLEKTEKEEYDLIFLDHRMPKMDGIETLRALKASPTNKNLNIPIISLTANAISGAREEYIRAGFDDYLTKPVNSAQLERLIIKYLPADKVNLSQERAVEKKEITGLPEWLQKIDTIDVAAGLVNCGSIEGYLETLKVFLDSIPFSRKEIQDYFYAEDWKDYTTKVHALKSTANIIGASELSEKAKRLENAGNNGYIEEIKKDTPALLELYGSYEQTLAPLKREEESDEGKTEISKAELEDAWETMREFAGAFDDDNMMFVLESLKEYRLPEKEADIYRRLFEAMQRTDWDTVQKLLKETT
ncbi:MAG: response regulator [Schwartzia sp.]|nr:response regulator [Schwartzia sp. (in: firmicutes)]